MTGRIVRRRSPYRLMLALMVLPGAALAAPAAIVEEVTGTVPGIESLDYVDGGRTIELRPGSGLVLGYLRSCVRETIRGGRVRVGTDRSEVTGGTVSRSNEPCSGEQLRLTGEQAGKSGAMVFRRPGGRGTADAPPAPEVIIHATSPVVTLQPPAAGAGQIRFDRLDREAPPLVVDIPGSKLDLASRNLRLAPAGLYRASYGDRHLVFQVDGKAVAGGGPVLRRLLRF